MWELLQNPILQITIRSIQISGTATLLASLWSLPLGILVGMKRFPGKQLAKGIFNALLGVPTIALGLILYLLFSRTGAFGFLHLFPSPQGIIIGQAILVTPIIISLSISAVESVDPEITDLAKTLGATEIEASLAVLRESIAGVALAIVVSFNRAIAELGIALAIGGNIIGDRTGAFIELPMTLGPFRLFVDQICVARIVPVQIPIDLIRYSGKTTKGDH